MDIEEINKSTIFNCICYQPIDYSNERNIQEHIKNCHIFQQKSPIYQCFSSLSLISLDFGQLLAIKYEYQNYIDQIEQTLKQKGYKKQQNFYNPHLQNSAYFGGMQIEKQTFQNQLSSSSLKQSKFNDEQFYQISHLSNTQIQCLNCKKQFFDFDTQKYWYLIDCIHCFCRACLVKHIDQNYIKCKGEVSCLSCAKKICQEDLQFLLGDIKLSQLDKKLIHQQYNIVSCVKCKNEFEFQTGKVEQNMKDQQGKNMTKQLAIHYAENRFICQNQGCKADQCKSCYSAPYHVGFNCEDFLKQKQAKKCRYCDKVMNNFNANLPLALQCVCSDDECQQKVQNQCQKQLNCGHFCCGYKNELECLPCVQENCAEKNQVELLEQKGEDYCNICYIEGLQNAPCAQLSCGHIYHYHCLEKRLDIKWHRPRITFTFCLCPLCKVWMQFKDDCKLQVKMNQNMVLYDDIKKRSLERLKHEDRDKDQRLKNPNDPYYQKPTEYAIAIYSYYMCFKCKNPYFGGLKNCEMLLEEEKSNEEFKKEELICANCTDIPISDCKKHGKDFIEFKCKFCCSVAQWFCWGTTHFCEPCHKRQTNGDYVTKIPVNKLPLCKGKETCPLKTDHKPNGEEASLGCSICRNIKDNQRNF